MTSAQAKRIGRLGGQRSALARRGSSAWGRSMVAKKGGHATAAHYPGLVREWMANARAVLRGERARELPSVASIKAPAPSSPGVQVHGGRAKGKKGTRGRG